MSFKPSSARGVRGTVQCLTILRSAAPVLGRILRIAVIGVHAPNASVLESLGAPCRLTAWSGASSFSERWEGSNVSQASNFFCTSVLT